MKPQILASCANCWHNGLQNGSVGLAIGYCAEHRVVLRLPEETTCARHTRKDLLFKSASAFRAIHEGHYTIYDGVQKLSDASRATTKDYIDTDTKFLRQDRVGEATADYGDYSTKIESLAQLKTLGTFRAEIAMLSLGRAYVDRCVRRNGAWTSGIHILWWTRRKIIENAPLDIHPSDLRYPTSSSLERQVELAKWSLLLFRLTYISDIGVHASKTDRDVGKLENIAEQAAEETEKPSLRKLEAWIKSVGVRLIDEALPESKYRAICAALSRTED